MSAGALSPPRRWSRSSAHGLCLAIASIVVLTSVLLSVDAAPQSASASSAGDVSCAIELQTLSNAPDLSTATEQASHIEHTCPNRYAMRARIALEQYRRYASDPGGGPAMDSDVTGHPPKNCAQLAQYRDNDLFNLLTALQDKLGRYVEARTAVDRARVDATRVRSDYQNRMLLVSLANVTHLTAELIEDLTPSATERGVAVTLYDILVKMQAGAAVLEAKDGAAALQTLLEAIAKDTNVIVKGYVAIKHLATNSAETVEFIKEAGESSSGLNTQITMIDRRTDALKARLRQLDTQVRRLNKVKLGIDASCGGYGSTTPKVIPIKPVGNGSDCAILRDETRSRTLLQSDANAWIALSNRCTR
jgi:hypothetical protein